MKLIVDIALGIPSLVIVWLFWGNLGYFAVKHFTEKASYSDFIEEHNAAPTYGFAKLALVAILCMLVLATMNFYSFAPSGDYTTLVTVDFGNEFYAYANADISIYSESYDGPDEREVYTDRTVWVNEIHFPTGHSVDCYDTVDYNGGTITVFDDDTEMNIIVPAITQKTIGVTPEFIWKNHKSHLIGFAFYIVTDILYVWQYINYSNRSKKAKDASET